MYVFKILIANTSTYENVDHHLYRLLHLLVGSRQIIDHEPHLIVKEDEVHTVLVICPEMDSMALKNRNIYCKEYWDKIEENSKSKIQVEFIGEDVQYPLPRYAVPVIKPSFYILRYGWYSPLMCGDTDTPIPLYKIPYTDEDENSFDNITCWEHHHQSLYRLWLSSQLVTEEFAQNQLEDVNSEHNKWGRKLCRIIEEKTGVPTYYFLPNFRKWTVQEDLNRKCPITGKDWLIAGSISADFIAFKCYESRLVSELSYGCVDLKKS